MKKRYFIYFSYFNSFESSGNGNHTVVIDDLIEIGEHIDLLQKSIETELNIQNVLIKNFILLGKCK